VWQAMTDYAEGARLLGLNIIDPTERHIYDWLRANAVDLIAAGRDAERYRWLKSECVTHESWYDEEGVEAVRVEYANLGGSLDEIIDDAMPEPDAARRMG
jgi:hypothetical protein